MVNSNHRTRWNVGVLVLPLRNKIKRLREKFISSASAATRSNRSAHTRRCCKGPRDGGTVKMVSARAEFESVILDQKTQEEIMNTQYWMNKEVRWR